MFSCIVGFKETLNEIMINNLWNVSKRSKQSTKKFQSFINIRVNIKTDWMQKPLKQDFSHPVWNTKLKFAMHLKLGNHNQYIES